MEKFKIFDTLSKRFILPESESNKRKFHKEIEKDKECILNFYRNEPFYKDRLDNMEMKSRGDFYYKSLIKNQVKKKNRFLNIILKSISAINNKPKNSHKISMKRYNLPKLQIIQERKNKLDLKLKSKEDESIENNKNSYLSSYKKYLENNYHSNKRLLSNSKSVVFSGVINNLDSNSTQKNNELTHSQSSNLVLTSKKNRINEINDLLDKCSNGIKSGDKLGGKMEKFTEKFSKKLIKEKKRINKEVDHNIQDQKIVEDKVSPKQKYKLLEIEKFKELKKRINAKISDNMVYLNRKEYTELVNDRKKIDEYNLYYEDVNKVYETIVQNRIKEKSKFNVVKNLLEDSYKKKNYLTNKVTNYYSNRPIKKNKSNIHKNNFELIINDEGERKENLGTLLPKLLAKRRENSVNNKKHIYNLI